VRASAVRTSAEASGPALRFEVPTLWAASLETVSLIAASLIATSLKTASHIAMSIVAASVGTSVIRMSPAVIPGACADEDPVREPAWAVISIGSAIVRIIRVIAVRADWRSSHISAEADSDSDLGLRVG